MHSERFLLDSNAFIAPSNTFYSFDFASGFWVQLEEHIRDGNVVLLDKVVKEITAGKGELADWICKLM